MKQITAFLLALGMTLTLCACSGSSGATTSTTETTTQEAPFVNYSTAPATVTATQTSNITAPDGTVLVTVERETVELALEDAAAQEKIQADLDALYNAFDSWAQNTADYATSDLADRAELSTVGDDSYEFTPYSAYLHFTVARADDTVISLVVDYEGYSGGAHGWDNRFTRNYNAKTGERVTFDALGDGFREKAEALVLAQVDSAVEDSSASCFFEDYDKEIPYVVADGTERQADVLERVYGTDAIGADTEDYMEPTFYFSAEGVEFVAGEYVMKPYAAGIIEFTVPYKDFGDTLNSDYIPNTYCVD